LTTAAHLSGLKTLKATPPNDFEENLHHIDKFWPEFQWNVG